MGGGVKPPEPLGEDTGDTQILVVRPQNNSVCTSKLFASREQNYKKAEIIYEPLKVRTSLQIVKCMSFVCFFARSLYDFQIFEIFII